MTNLDRYNNTTVLPKYVNEVNYIVDKIIANKKRYAAIATQVNGAALWYIVALVHYRECDLNFKQHIANGDPLTNKTVNETKGLPTYPMPKGGYIFDDAAVFELKYEGFAKWLDWSTNGMMDKLERFNGLGYRNLAVPSPYLWSYTNMYTSGKYDVDGHYNSTLIDKQAGCVAIYKTLIQKGALN